jgi:hypothetical protein
MDKAAALARIQRMHETQIVTNDAIIAWYEFYADKLPKMHPERSDVDLIRTIALWMDLTDRGGSPEFPYEYRSALSFPSIDSTRPPKTRIIPLLGNGTSLVGILLLFFYWKLALMLIVGGQVVDYIAYRVAGGAANPDLMTPGTTLYEKQGKRVLDWASRQEDAQVPGS